MTTMMTPLRFTKHLATFLLVKLPVQFMGIPIVAVELLRFLDDSRTANCEDQRLFFKWFDNGDALDRKYGLNGDGGYQEIFRGETLGLKHPAASHLVGGTIPSKWKLYKMRLNWLAWRNPANYFQRHVLGVKVSDLRGTMYHFEDSVQGYPPVPVGDWTSEGTRETLMELNSGEIIWEYYTIKKYSFWEGHCFRARLGYKLGETPMVHTGRDTVQWCFSVNPFASYTGA